MLIISILSMKMLKYKSLILSILLVSNLFSQLKTGIYNDWLNIVYDNSSNNIKGYFQAESGYDEQTKNSKFYCEFYFYSTESIDHQFKIKSFWQGDSGNLEDTIYGKIIVTSPTSFSIKLDSEHGGCWNVNHFADTLTIYELSEKKNWIDIRYCTKDKIYFFDDSNAYKKRKAFIIKGDLVYIEKQENNWVYCTYFGEKINTTGWLKLEDLNK